MKALKIFLTISVIGGIIYSIFLDGGIDTPPKIGTSGKNTFIEKIRKETVELQKLSDDTLTYDEYSKILAEIDDDFNNQVLGSGSDNQKWKEILTSDLYAVYAPKFTKQAKNALLSCNPASLNIIRGAVTEFILSPYLDNSGLVYNELIEIQSAISKYDEIFSFLQDYNQIENDFSTTEIKSTYPLDRSKAIIQKSKEYLNNNLDNQYLINCIDLKIGLENIPLSLLNIHYTYIKNKIDIHGDKYKEYNYQSEYITNIYNPLLAELQELNENHYGSVISDEVLDKYIDLKFRLGSHSLNAYNYFK